MSFYIKSSIIFFENRAHFLYKTTNFYNRESEGSILWNDPDLSIQWPIGGASPLVSNKDDQSPFFKDAKYFD